MRYLSVYFSILWLLGLPSFTLVPDKPQPNLMAPSPHVKGQILVRIDPNFSAAFRADIEKSIGAKHVRNYALVEGLGIYKFDPRLDVMEVVKSLSSKPFVIYAEPDYLYRIAKIEDVAQNDPEYPKQWALENTGQAGGKPDADINAELMWNYQKGSRDIVVGIIDTGFDYTHPDLADNAWINPGEIPNNGIDDDYNGFVDDMHGINAINNTGNPMDDNVHGTHVSGTIGAKGNNRLGVVGVAQNIQIAACKFLSSTGTGSISDALQCMDYFAALKSRQNNPVNLIATNNSWGGGGSSQAMLDAIRAHERLGILFIAAAGNESSNNDSGSSYPANYNVSNVISVAATDNNDRLASFSNYGKKTVHVAAPGVKILSTILNGKFGELSGTSMATPHVTGLVAIIASQFKGIDYINIKNLVMAGGQKTLAASTTTISGRRLRGADLNGIGSLSCGDQIVSARKQPAGSNYSINLGKSLFLAAMHVNCSSNAGPLTLYQNGDQSVVLYDDGQNGDVTAGDGIYSLNWTPTIAGIYRLMFSDTDIVDVTVFQATESLSYQANDQIPSQYISIGGQRLGAGDETMHWVTSPFPILFAGDTKGFSELYVSSNGTISFTDRAQPGSLNQVLPATSFTTLVAPFWDDLKTVGNDSNIYVAVVGAEPHRQLVVEWWKVTHFLTTGLGAFQVVFYENSSDFSFNYLDTNFGDAAYDSGASATVGVQISPENALEYSFNIAMVSSQKSIYFSLQ